MKQCKQCKKMLPAEKFRTYLPRSKGVYKRHKPTSYNTICKNCEAVNMRAHNILKKIDAGLPYDQATFDELKAYYIKMSETGRPPLTAAARRLIGLEPLNNVSDTQKAIDDVLRVDELSIHVDKVMNRSYATFDEADEVHRRLTPRLREAGLYEDVNNMMDDWYMDL